MSQIFLEIFICKYSVEFGAGICCGMIMRLKKPFPKVRDQLLESTTFLRVGEKVGHIDVTNFSRNFYM